MPFTNIKRFGLVLLGLVGVVHAQRVYTGERLSRVAFPIGGIGAGMFCLEGTGTISHLSIRNHPDVWNEPPFFAALAIKGEPTHARVLEGPVPGWKKFGVRESGYGDVKIQFLQTVLVEKSVWNPYWTNICGFKLSDQENRVSDGK